MRSITRYFCAVCCTAVLAGCKGGPAPDFSGQWAEKSAERVVAVFAPAAEGGYRVQAGWRETGLAQYEAWDMSTKPGKGGALTYSDGCLERFSFEREGDTEYVEEIVYTDGAGSFRMSLDQSYIYGSNTHYRITYALKVKSTGAYRRLAQRVADTGHDKITLKNTAKVGEVSDDLDFDFEYAPITKTLAKESACIRQSQSIRW